MKRPSGFSSGEGNPPSQQSETQVQPDKESVSPRIRITRKTQAPQRSASKTVNDKYPAANGSPALEQDWDFTSPTIDLGEVRTRQRQKTVESGEASGILPNAAKKSSAKRVDSSRKRDPWSPRGIAQSTAQAVRRAVAERRRAERREVKRFTVESRRRRRTLTVVAGALAALVLFVLVGVFSPLMGLRTIEVVGAERLDAAAVVEALDGHQGVPLSLIDRGRVQSDLEQFSIIQSYSLELRPPHTMVVRIIERNPVMSVHTETGFSLIDSAGVTVETAAERPAGFPLVVNVPVDADSRVFQATTEAVRTLPPDVMALIDTVTAGTENEVSFQLRDSGITVVWGSSKESPRKGAVLRGALAGLADRNVTSINVASPENIVFS
ncbi:FtsQ-type POTRA domain-containing protein [Lysinibacter sp. HNR]|uniref:FtsQ-type POTRA domain-containing protein n=1 Tax=Lysinibacter sp. HNR TaxID=3031408 RepID=UPI002434E63C|nr:FtsQ-type POTRA domain-containing protein [Lysinibacter sp. HNR]WGD36467.1 FtsQ-type POTRA domain-containing protein [Lysinibacter sp. HNR]